MIKITSWNVNEQEFNNIKIGENDIILLQEVNSKNVTDEKHGLLNQHFMVGQYFDKKNITDMEKGYMIIYGKNFVIENNNIKPAYIKNVYNLYRSTNWLFLNKTSNKNDKYAIISVHLPFSNNADDKFNIINSIIEEGNTYIKKGYIVIIGGDFNIKSDDFNKIKISNFKCNYDTKKITNDNSGLIKSIKTTFNEYIKLINTLNDKSNIYINSFNLNFKNNQNNTNENININNLTTELNNLFNININNYNENNINLIKYDIFKLKYILTNINNNVNISINNNQNINIKTNIFKIIEELFLKCKYFNHLFQEHIDYILYSPNAIQIGDESVEWYKINGNDTLDKYDHAKISINIIPIKDLNDIKHNNNFISSKDLNIQLYNDIKNNSYKEDFYNKIKF